MGRKLKLVFEGALSDKKLEELVHSIGHNSLSADFVYARGKQAPHVYNFGRGNIPSCVPMPHDETLLEIFGVGEASTADQYCRAIEQYCADQIEEKEMWYIISARTCQNNPKRRLVMVG